jgi:hypothetical protein
MLSKEHWVHSFQVIAVPKSLLALSIFFIQKPLSRFVQWLRVATFAQPETFGEGEIKRKALTGVFRHDFIDVEAEKSVYHRIEEEEKQSRADFVVLVLRVDVVPVNACLNPFEPQ